MKRILFAWEFGANLGHLSRDLPLARRCLAAGYDVLWAVPDPRGAQVVLAQEPFRLAQSPRLNAAGIVPRPPASYSDMLLNAGFHDETSLVGTLRAWRSLLELFHTDAMVFNHAPTALLAARTLSIPVLVTGTGFEVPPSQRPMPTFRPWDRQAQVGLDQFDSRLTISINQALAAFDAPPLNSLADLFDALTPTLTTFEELDPFGPRAQARYIGPVFTLPELDSAVWLTTDRPRIFAYLRPGLGGCEALLAALNAIGAEVICFMPGRPDNWETRYNSVSFRTEPVAVDELLKTASLTITSGAGTIASSLLAGVPVLVVPQVLEQDLAGRRLAATGAGLSIADRRTTPLFGAVLHQLLSRPEFKAKAMAFAGKYRDYSQESALGMQFDSLEAVLACRSS